MELLVNNRKLLTAFRAGETWALTMVYGEYAKPVFSYLYKGFSFQSQGIQCSFQGLHQQWQLEGAVQDVFVRAFSPKARASYDGLRPYSNYLFTIARNLVIDNYRRGERENTVENIDHEIEQRQTLGDLGDPADPEENVQAQQLSEQATLFAEKLAGIEADVFRLRFREGESIEQVARILAVSEHSVKSTEKRLKRSFFLRMRSIGYFSGLVYGPNGIEKDLSLLLMMIWGNP